MEVWTTIIPHLVEDYSVHTIAVPGHSSDSDVSDPTSAMESLFASYDNLDLERPLVVGHSLGTALAVLLMSQKEVSGLVILDQCLNSTDVVDTAKTLENAAKTSVQTALSELFQTFGSDRVIAQGVRGLGLPHLTLQTLNSLWSGGGEGIWPMLHALLATSDKPILSLEWSEFGDAYDAWCSETVPRMTRERMPDSDHHWFFVDQPKETADRIRLFDNNMSSSRNAGRRAN